MRLGSMAIGLALVTVAVLWPASQASPAALETHVLASMGPDGYDYTVTEVVADVDGTLVFTNLDPLRVHDVVSTLTGPDDNPWCDRFASGACPLFASPLIGTGQQAPVEGVHALLPHETYDFYCSIHPWMTGTLHTI